MLEGDDSVLQSIDDNIIMDILSPPLCDAYENPEKALKFKAIQAGSRNINGYSI